MYILLTLMLIICSTLFSAPPDSLQTTPAHSRFDLDEIRVVATAPSESAGKIDIIHLDNTAKSSEINLSDIMRDISGVSITLGGRGETNMRIRGFRRENVKIMIDGRQVNAGYFGNVNLAEMPMFDISEIHVVKGAVSPLYGTNSMGGVVNFVTHKPSNDSWLTLKGSVKRNNTQTMQLITARSFEIWDYWLNLSGFKTDGFMLSNNFTPTPNENGGVRDFSNNKNFNIQSKINFSLFDIHSIGFSGSYSFADERNVPHNIYEKRYRQFKDLKRWSLTGISAFQVTPFLNIQPQVYYDAYDNIYQEFTDPDLTQMGLDSLLESWTFGTQIRADYVIDIKNKLYFLYKFEKEAYNRIDNQGYTDWTSNSTLLNNGSLMLNHKFNSLWQSSVGLGVSKNHIVNNDGETPSVRWRSEIADTGNGETPSVQTHFEPSFSIHYNDLSNSLNFAISRNIQYPYLRQLFSDSRGNPYLKPEKAIKTEIGVGKNFISDGFVFIPNISLFYNNIQDMIDRVNSTIYINQTNLQNAGADLEIYTYVPAISDRHLSLETQHNLSYINLKMNPDYTFYEIPQWTFNNTFSIIINTLKLSYSINYSDSMYSPDDIGKLHFLPSKILHNSNINYNFRNLNLGLSLSNIFDKDYQEEYGYPAPGRDFSISFEWVVF